MLALGAPPFCKTPENWNDLSKNTSVEYTVSPFCFSTEESNPNRETEASDILGFEDWERIEYVDLPLAGITSSVVVPCTISKGVGSKSS